VEDDVEEAGALAADLGAAEACAVLEADAVFFLFEEAFVEFEDLFWWGGWVESRCEDAAGVGLDFVEVTGHEGRCPALLIEGGGGFVFGASDWVIGHEEVEAVAWAADHGWVFEWHVALEGGHDFGDLGAVSADEHGGAEHEVVTPFEEGGIAVGGVGEGSGEGEETRGFFRGVRKGEGHAVSLLKGFGGGVGAAAALAGGGETGEGDDFLGALGSGDGGVFVGDEDFVREPEDDIGFEGFEFQLTFEGGVGEGGEDGGGVRGGGVQSGAPLTTAWLRARGRTRAGGRPLRP
jgi:hypothetical protein